MTVKELMEKLQKCDQEKEVVVHDFGKSADFKVIELPLKDIVYLAIV